MNNYKLLARLLFVSCFFLVSVTGFCQITSDADKVVPTEYSSGAQDNIHIFCSKKGELNAALTANLSSGATGTFEWLKYNQAIGDFDPIPGGVTGAGTSTISGLSDGCYRVNITTASGVITYTAWAFNNYIEATAEIPESDCTSFTLEGTLISPSTLTYVDLPTGQVKLLGKGIKYLWTGGDIGEQNFRTYRVFDPPTNDTNYKLKVTDRFGCTTEIEVLYESIVTKALFSVSKDKGEAPLEVTFNNESENGDPGKFEWFIYRDLDELKREKEQNGVVKDSILIKLFNDSPVYKFENTGTYKVKLVSKKVSELNTCYDTVYLAGFIVADTSFVAAPNVFTPNGDGINDKFIVKFWSMKEVKISIFNRWGKLLHVWESNNVNGFGNTVESIPQSVWDGKVGGKVCTPGVYYYVVEGRGRDNERRRANGFFHLFRGK